MPFWFIPAITQSMAWSLQAPFLASCPSENPVVDWQIFPQLNATTIINSNGSTPEPAISTIGPSLSQPGQSLNLTWDNSGLSAGPNSTYNASSMAGEPKFAAWISQLNVTYTPLTNFSGNSALTIQPSGNVFQDILGNDTTPLINGTIFLLLTDDKPYVTPYNLSQLESHIVAGPVLYTVG
ncbi:hypothetical protein QCA50_011528 [Cerrena zonata]|uniref:Uncharacterized protein n=1 Tax=Cerrena zonata TaxID=2478898 RepID=A0AAW0G834_9APHY